MIHNRGDAHMLTPHAMAQGGDAVARLDGMACFVSGALPDEQVRVVITDVQKNFLKASVTEVIEASSLRVPVRVSGAPHMEWQHIDPVAQLEFKRQILFEQLTHLGKLTNVPTIQTAIGSPSWHYRNSARLHGYGHYLGYRAEGSAHVIEVADDPLLHPVLQQALVALRAVLVQHQPEPRTAWSMSVRVSETSGQVVAAIKDLPNRLAITIREAWVARLPQLVGVLMPYGVVEGEGTVRELHYGVALDLGATTFFQVSLGAARALCDAVMDGLSDVSSGHVIDAYCGAGTFTLPVAQIANHVTAIEEYAPSVEAGQQNAWQNDIGNIDWRTAPVEKALRNIGDADAVVLDPPRRGLHPAVIGELARISPMTIVYVSCHPGTLARDVAQLVEHGYRIDAVTCIDCFPQTAHVESVTVLRK